MAAQNPYAGYSFCESEWAGPLSKWHIRKLTDVGKKPGGGIDTSSLCNHVQPRKGWDLEVPITEHHLTHCCGGCRTALLQEIGNG